MSDAALDALASKREAELLAHAAVCDGCRVVYQHARELAALVDRGVESVVAGEPPAHFAARLRARIASEPEPVRAAWLAWKPIAAGLVAAMAAALLFVWHVPGRHPSPAPVGVRTEVTANPRATLSAGPETQEGLSAKPTTKQLQVRRGYHFPSRQALVAQSVSRRARVARSPGTPAQPEVILPPGQLAAVMQLAKAIKSGQIDGKKILAAERDADKPLEIAPIEIAPIEIAPLETSRTSTSSAEHARASRP